ncbi:MAG: hypothetical protein KAS32_04920 [Candidatus Peribacteraceae bacterium]|nr:hypothetical protein [Candidatus Peribacteraceae bacterium]
MKTEINFKWPVIIICASIALFIFLISINSVTKKEVSNEAAQKPETTPTEQPIPTPTSTPKPKLRYHYGEASWYDTGEESDDALTTACSDDFSVGSILIVTYQGKSIKVRCNGRGAFKEVFGRILDLSKEAFSKLSPLEAGVIEVKVEVLK